MEPITNGHCFYSTAQVLKVYRIPGPTDSMWLKSYRKEKKSMTRPILNSIEFCKDLPCVVEVQRAFKTEFTL